MRRREEGVGGAHSRELDLLVLKVPVAIAKPPRRPTAGIYFKTPQTPEPS